MTLSNQPFSEEREEEIVNPTNRWMGRAKWLTHALLFSGALNIGLVATFVYFVLQEKSESQEYALEPLEEPQESSPEISIDTRSNREVLNELSTLNSDTLIVKLNSTQLVEDGFYERDLALAYLVAFYDFDLQRALLTLPIQKRQFSFSSPYLPAKSHITVYSGLTDTEYERIIYFAKTEQWPYTSRGLFKRLQSLGMDTDHKLCEAFYLTSDFMLIEALFSRADITVFRKELLELVLEGSWHDFSIFVDDQRKAQDLSLSRRIRFLLDYIYSGSQKAAYLLLKVDPIFALKKLDDNQVLTILRLLTSKTEISKEFALNILKSNRSDNILNQASYLLYLYEGEILDSYDHQLALRRFQKPNSKKLSTNHITIPPKASMGDQKVYTIQKGDTLWKIARNHDVEVAALKQKNHLESDIIHIGQIIQIP